MGFFASVSGIVTPVEEARVSVLDNGFTFGDSVYETLRTYDGQPLQLSHVRMMSVWQQEKKGWAAIAHADSLQ